MNPEFLFYSSTKYTTSGCKDIRISNLVKLITSLIQISQTLNSIKSTNSSVTCTPLGCKDMRVNNLKPNIIDLCMNSFHIQSLYFFAVHTSILIFMISVCRKERGGGGGKGKSSTPLLIHMKTRVEFSIESAPFSKNNPIWFVFQTMLISTALKCMIHRKTWLSCLN